MNWRIYLSTFSFHFCLIFCCANILFFPVPYYLFPNVGSYFEPVIDPLIRWAGTNLFRVEEPFTSSLISDSKGLYVFVALLAIFSGILAVIIPFVFRKRISRSFATKISLWFYTVMSYYLALTLLKYGADKIFKHQFYLPEPNTLFTPVGDMTPDLLFWSSMGSSYSYTVFSGIIEIIPALFLLFRKTRLIGIIISVGVLTNVVMINFGFDITVKVYSLFLFFLSLVLLAPNLTPLYKFFVLREKAEQVDSGFMIDSKTSLTGYTIVKTLVIGLLLFESCGIYFAANNLNDDNGPRPPLYGAYDVYLFTDNGNIVPASMSNPGRFKRVFFHRRSYFIVQTMDDHFVDYKVEVNQVTKRLLLSSSSHAAHDGKTSELTYQINGDELVILGFFFDSYITLYSKKIDLKELPLLKEEFHWTIDDFQENQ
jgi:hypothetical protein